MKALTTIVMLLALLTSATSQGSQASSTVQISVHEYLNVHFDGSSGGTKDVLLVLGAAGKRALRVERRLTAKANVPFTVEARLFALFPEERFWTVDVDDLRSGAQLSFASSAGVRHSVATVTVNAPHGRTPVAGVIALTISPQ